MNGSSQAKKPAGRFLRMIRGLRRPVVIYAPITVCIYANGATTVTNTGGSKTAVTGDKPCKS